MAGKSRSTAALITEKGWTKACMRWAGKDPQQSVRHLADASQAAYEYSLLEGESYLPKKRLAGYDQAIRRKEVKDAKTYRNVATAYLTLERLLEGRAPGRRERRQAEHLEKAFCTAYKKAAEDYLALQESRDPTPLLLYGQMMEVLEAAARQKLMHLFENPSGVLGSVLGITAFLIRSLMAKEEAGELTREMCRFYYEDLEKMRCNVDMVARQASTDLQSMLSSAIEGSRDETACCEENFASALSAKDDARLRADIIIDRHIAMCRWIL